MLCLRIPDGLGRERDFEELKRRKVDVDGWENLSKKLKEALKPHVLHGPIANRVMESVLSEAAASDLPELDFISSQAVPELSEPVFNRLDLSHTSLPIGHSLSSNEQPDLHSQVIDT